MEGAATVSPKQSINPRSNIIVLTIKTATLLPHSLRQHPDNKTKACTTVTLFIELYHNILIDAHKHKTSKKNFMDIFKNTSRDFILPDNTNASYENKNIQINNLDYGDFKPDTYIRHFAPSPPHIFDPVKVFNEVNNGFVNFDVEQVAKAVNDETPKVTTPKPSDDQTNETANTKAEKKRKMRLFQNLWETESKKMNTGSTADQDASRKLILELITHSTIVKIQPDIEKLPTRIRAMMPDWDNATTIDGQT